MILSAKFVAPVDAPVIEDGAIRIQGEQIAAVSTASEAGRTNEERIDFGSALIVPGFVNAHTHLELTHLAGRVLPSPDFTDWLARLVHRGIEFEPTKTRVKASVADGVAQSLSAGVTTLGDITRFPAWTRETLASTALRAVSFGEVISIGSRRHLLDERLDAAVDTDDGSERLTCGVSPHAPYTVEPAALRQCAERSSTPASLLCVHVAETPEEEEFTRTRTGPFVDYLKKLGVWDDHIPIGGMAPVPLLEATGLLTERTVLAHANYVGDEDIRLIARSGASVAYCPRTHDAFGHSPHRFEDMLAAGVNVCIGTDSLASNPSLSILDEIRFIHQIRPDITPETLLELATLAGAKALGVQGRVGSLFEGKDADIAVVPLADGNDWRSVFTSTVQPIAVLSRGRLIVDNR